MSHQKIKYGKYGKPYISGECEFHYNISHSGEWVICGIHDKDIGIDIQKIDDSKQTFFEEYYSGEELLTGRYWKTAEIVYYTYVWTIKESYFKLFGMGINEDFEKLIVVSVNPLIIRLDGKIVTDVEFYSFMPDRRHIISIAIMKEPAGIRKQQVIEKINLIVKE